MLSSTGLRFEDVYRIKRSPDGEGAAVRDGMYGGTAFPVSGTDTVTSNYKDGRQTAAETFTLGVPRLNGIGAITGHGRCTGGTNQHQLEKCSYTFRGTYDLQRDRFACHQRRGEMTSSARHGAASTGASSSERGRV
jgi:hypothetical protein